MLYVGIDLGGTNIAAGLTDENGRIIVQDSVPTGKERAADEIVSDMAKLSLELIAKVGRKISDVAAVGIGCPGTIDQKNGVVTYSNNIPMEKYPMTARLAGHMQLPVYMDNDANCAALGEYVVSGEGVQMFVMITLGTGVGGGIVSGGRLFRGFNGAASEPGHFTLVSGGEMCTCGKAGCWEAYASVTALIRQTEAAMKKNPTSMMNEIAKREGKISGRTAFEAAKAGDAAGREVVAQYVRYVADGIVSIENILQPQIIAVGGGISREGEYLMNPVREYVQKVRFNKFMPKTKIITAKLFNDAGIIGAAMNAKISHEGSL